MWVLTSACEQQPIALTLTGVTWRPPWETLRVCHVLARTPSILLACSFLLPLNFLFFSASSLIEYSLEVLYLNKGNSDWVTEEYGSPSTSYCL